MASGKVDPLTLKLSGQLRSQFSKASTAANKATVMVRADDKGTRRQNRWGRW